MTKEIRMTRAERANALKASTLESKLLEIAGKGMTYVWKHFSSQSPDVSEVFPKVATQVNENDLFDRATPQIGEGIPSRKMCQLANEQIDRLF